jgi:hypothetical protein
MKRITYILCIATCMTAMNASASIVLDGAHLLEQTATGDYSGAAIWSTTGCCALAQLGIGTTPANATFLNTSAGDLAYTVPDGTTHFVLIGQPGYSVPKLGVSLFFNETSGAPQIGVYGNPMAASGIQRTYDYYSGSVPAGGLSYTNGGQTVTLSNFVFTNGSGATPIYASFDLTSSSSGVPEPATVGLMAGALAALGLLRRRACR